MAINPEIIKKYSDEMLEMRKRAAIPTAAQPMSQSEMAGEGGLLVRVTTLGELYPVGGASVTVYTGESPDRVELFSGRTDESGKTEVIRLKTPNRDLSESAGAQTLPYSSYNVLVRADGYVDNIHKNVPVFPDTVSVQTADMLSLAAAGGNLAPRVFDESRRYEL